MDPHSSGVLTVNTIAAAVKTNQVQEFIKKYPALKLLNDPSTVQQVPLLMFILCHLSVDCSFSLSTVIQT